MRKKVVFGFLGTNLDSGLEETRWQRWRPTVSLCWQESFQVDRVELFICSTDHESLAGQIRDDVARVSQQTEVISHLLDIANPWDFATTYAALHDFFSAYQFDSECDYYAHLTTGTHTAQICLFLLSESRHLPGKLVDTNPVSESDEPWRGNIVLIDLNLAMYDQLASRFKRESIDSEALLKNGISTNNAAFNKLIGNVENVSLRSDAPILLTGPTGSGKSQLARQIYALRSRRHKVTGEFVEVNCATLRGDNAMSALFGHRKGAFTGAVADRPGLLKTAENGILFLDEIGTLGADEQAMLLRAIEEKKFYPMGSDKEVSSDFQLLAGTNLDLGTEVAQGRFRADLYARINLWSYRLPSLAERPEDIAPNIGYELDRVSALLKCRVSFTAAAYASYLAFAQKAPWCGNFRDLAASITRLSTLAEGARILENDVKEEIERLECLWAPEKNNIGASASLSDKILPHRKMDAYDAAQLEVVLQAIRRTRSMAEAGRELFAESRTERKTINDSHRVRTILTGFGLDYKETKLKLEFSN